MKLKSGDLVIIPGLFIVGKVKNVSIRGSIQIIYVESTEGEFRFTGFLNDNRFNFRKDFSKGMQNVSIVKVSSLINVIGVILMLAISLYFFGG